MINRISLSPTDTFVKDKSLFNVDHIIRVEPKVICRSSNKEEDIHYCDIHLIDSSKVSVSESLEEILDKLNTAEEREADEKYNLLYRALSHGVS